jgi:hypothetical protein
MLNPSAAPIVAEIAERLAELDDHKLCAAHDLCRRLTHIGDRTPRLFRPVLAALTGDTLAVVESYAVQADRRGLTKQALHVEWHLDVARLREIFPDLAQELQNMRDRCENHEPTGTNAQAFHSGDERETPPGAGKESFLQLG